MVNSIIFIVAVILFAIGFIVLVSGGLQQRLVDNRFTSSSIQPSEGNDNWRYFELSEKLRLNLGIELPTYRVQRVLPIPI
jgi:hypothetical protein